MTQEIKDPKELHKILNAYSSNRINNENQVITTDLETLNKLYSYIQGETFEYAKNSVINQVQNTLNSLR